MIISMATPYIRITSIVATWNGVGFDCLACTDRAVYGPMKHDRRIEQGATNSLTFIEPNC